MQLESLKMFVDVVNTGSFSRAARLNHVTQSAVSQQIRALENRYQQKLLSRSSRQVAPTSAGERLFRCAKEILGRFDEMESELREQDVQVSGTCTLSAIYSVGLHELHAFQKEILRKYPTITFRLAYRRSEQVYDDILLGAADIGIVAYPQARAGVDILPFREDRLVLVMNPKHPLASKNQVDMTSLQEEPYIGFDREAPSRRGIDRLFRERGVELHPILEIDNVETIKRGIELGLGVAVLPQPTIAHESDNGSLVARELVGGPFTRPIAILKRKGKYLSRAVQLVLETLKTFPFQNEGNPS